MIFIFIILVLFLFLLLSVIYILYMNKSNNFEDATVCDGDNEFEQMEKIIKKLERLTNDRRN